MMCIGGGGDNWRRIIGIPVEKFGRGILLRMMTTPAGVVTKTFSIKNDGDTMKKGTIFIIIGCGLIVAWGIFVLYLELVYSKP
ncbi:hypothetical protein ES705_30996 [subsurface metagenome]